jgi:hypothetical protein
VGFGIIGQEQALESCCYIGSTVQSQKVLGPLHLGLWHLLTEEGTAWNQGYLGYLPAEGRGLVLSEAPNSRCWLPRTFEAHLTLRFRSPAGPGRWAGRANRWKGAGGQRSLSTVPTYAPPCWDPEETQICRPWEEEAIPGLEKDANQVGSTSSSYPQLRKSLLPFHQEHSYESWLLSSDRSYLLAAVPQEATGTNRSCKVLRFSLLLQNGMVINISLSEKGLSVLFCKRTAIKKGN